LSEKVHWSVGCLQFDFDARMTFHEVAHRRNDEGGGECLRCTDLQEAGRLSLPVRGLKSRFVDVDERGLDTPVEDLASLGGPRLARRSAHELDLQILLEGRERAADRLQ